MATSNATRIYTPLTDATSTWVRHATAEHRVVLTEAGECHLSMGTGEIEPSPMRPRQPLGNQKRGMAAAVVKAT